MANTKKKKISVNELDKCIDFLIHETEVEYNGLCFMVKSGITIEDMATFVNNVVESCFADEGEYFPQVFEYAFRCEVIDKYTNISLPQSMNKKYALVYSGIYGKIIENTNLEQILDIQSAIKNKIKYIKDSNIEAINKQIKEVYNIVNELQGQFEALYEGVNNKDLMDMIKSLGQNGIDEEKLMNAYMKAKEDKTETSGDE